MSHRIVVCGTGTEVGKTHVAVALVAALARRSESVVGLKPIESGIGVESETDSFKLGTAGTFHVKKPLYGFQQPVSPHLAARNQGVIIDLENIISWIGKNPASYQVIETAGGLFSPLAPGITNLTFLNLVEPTTTVLVSVDQLGVLHNVTACLRAFDSASNVHVVLSRPETPDESTSTNAEELRTLGISSLPLVFPRASLNHSKTKVAADQLAELVLS